jgi:predicted cupin superfamily sugar epimerase
MDKNTDFPSNMTAQFIATQLHVSGGHYRSTMRASNKNTLKKVEMHTKYTPLLFL